MGARISVFSIWFILMSLASPAIAQWSAPEILWQEAWADPLNLDIDASASRLVTLIPTSGSDDTSRHLMVTEKVNGAWQTPEILATNGIYSDDPFQVLPSTSTPVMSDDGETIAFLGFTGTDNGVYICDWLGAAWGAPALLATGLASHHYWLSLSADGKTLALSDYPFFGIRHVYVATRGDGGGWSAVVQVSSDSGDIGGGFPSLSADGRRLAWVANARLAYSEYGNGSWSAPVTLTSNTYPEHYVDYPQMSGDGASIHYWLVELEDNGTGYTAVAQDLYLMRKEVTGWGAPQKVNNEPVLPTLSVTNGPAAANHQATRLVFTRAAFTTDGGDTIIHASHLDVSEWQGGNSWLETRLVAEDGWGNYNRFPKLTPDGLVLAFDGGVRFTPSYVPYALWEMATADEPPDGPSIFADGFESGDTTRWSTSVQ